MKTFTRNKVFASLKLTGLLFILWGGWVVFEIFTRGLGVLGLNNTVVWGVLITNFVFWIGLAHAGTFISAILLITRQDWRYGISRMAESTTVLALLIACMMPVIHLGVPEKFYELLPNPNFKLNYFLVNFGSPLTWDFYAIGTYFILSLLFIFMEWLEVLNRASLDNRMINKLFHRMVRRGLRWPLTIRELAIDRMALLMTVLVISVHTVVSFDFAVSVKSNWHESVFPPYFVLGAVYSGFALVYVVLIAAEYAGWKKLTEAQIRGITGLLLFCAVAIGFLRLWMMISKAYFPSSIIEILVLVLTILVVQIFWVRKIRFNLQMGMVVSWLVLAGMWLERFEIVVMGLAGDSLLNRNVLDFTLNDGALILAPFGFFLWMIIPFLKFLSRYDTQKEKENSPANNENLSKYAISGGVLLFLISILMIVFIHYQYPWFATGIRGSHFSAYIPPVIIFSILGAGLGIFVFYFFPRKKHLVTNENS